jgi:hypothetical protein
LLPVCPDAPSRPSDHNLIRWSASCILAELEAADLQLLFAAGDRW